MIKRPKVVRRRVVLLAVAMVMWAGLIGARLYSLQVIQADSLKERAERQQKRVLEISPRRGAIYDRNGRELAVSVKVDSVFAVPAEVRDINRTARVLSTITDMGVEPLEARIRSERPFVWIKRKAGPSEGSRIRQADLPGIYLQKEDQRFYPKRELAAHVLGYVSIDEEGLGGLEYRYNQSIRGQPGRVVMTADARGRGFHRVDQLPEVGASLITTIDENIQYIVEKELMATVGRTGASGMSIIAMDPRNGEVLAMASYPRFNPNEYARSAPTSRINRAISHTYEPGSTFKIVTAAAALEEQLTHLGEVIDCQMGSIVLFGHRIRDHKAFGTLTVKQIMQFSSDVGMIKLGMRLGDDRFADYIERMGFGKRTNIDLSGEERGITRPASKWSKISVGAISMGQEISVTPLQIVNLVSAVASGGILYRPTVVLRVVHPEKGKVPATEPRGERIMSPETAGMLEEMLEAVVNEGTAAAARMSRYRAAGKTGTAQKIDETGTYSKTRYVASFVGYVPVTDPVLSLVVVIDEPIGRYHGGEVAAPVFKKIAEQVLRYLAVLPDVPSSSRPQQQEVLSRVPGPGLRASARDGRIKEWKVLDVSLSEVSSPEADSRFDRYALVELPVPDFSGKPLRQVTEYCLRLGLRLRARGSGVAVEQIPAAGSIVRSGARVQIRFSTSVGRK